MLNQRQTVIDNIERYNKFNPLADFLIPLIGNKKEVKIADIGSGAYSKIGRYLNGIEVTVFSSDNQDFTEFWKKYKATPLYEIEYQDMENLIYEDNYFDIVHCANALDHTEDALAAVKEMIRVCKPGGWVYIECNLFQLNTGHGHKWNANAHGVFTNKTRLFDLKNFGFEIKFIDNGGEARYNQIIATLQK